MKAISPTDLFKDQLDQKRIEQLIETINKLAKKSYSWRSIAVYGITYIEFEIPISSLKNYSNDEITAVLIQFQQTGWDISLHDTIRTHYIHFSCMKKFHDYAK